MATAYEYPIRYLTGNPAADFTNKRYTAVKFDANGDIVPCGAGERAIGIIQEPNNVGEPAQVMIEGISFAVLGGTVAPNDEVSVDANGHIVKASTATFSDTGATAHTLNTTAVIGVCVVGGNAGEIGSILLK